MAHFAQLNDNNEVIQVLVVNDDYLKDENGNEVEELGRAHMEAAHGGRWIQTSYNNNFRVRYAGIGYTYNEALDAFIPPKALPSFVLNNSTLDWEPPIPYPNDENQYKWNEETCMWEQAISEEDFKTQLNEEEIVLWEDPDLGTEQQEETINTVKQEFPLLVQSERFVEILELLESLEIIGVDRAQEILDFFVPPTETPTEEEIV